MNPLIFKVEDAWNHIERSMTVTPEQHGVTIELEGCPHPIIVDVAKGFLRVFQDEHENLRLLGEIQCFTT